MSVAFPFRGARDAVEARERAKARAEGRIMREACTACGRELNPATRRYAIYEASCYLALGPAEAFEFPLAQGYWELSVVAIGPECAKKLQGRTWANQDEPAGIVAESRKRFDARVVA